MSPGAAPSRLRLGLTCCSIAANSLCAGGIFMFPIFSPALASILKLTQPQLTTVVLAAMVGQYPFSPIVGKVLDLYGSSTCSLIAGMFFSTAFALSAMEITSTPVDIEYPSTASFHRLTFFFLLAGLGTVFSYFSSIFAASKNFPNHPGLASGLSMALFGLSPLCLSVFASNFFTEPTSGLLNVARFMVFMALLTASTHILGAFALRSAPIANTAVSWTSNAESGLVDENTNLIPRKPTIEAGEHLDENTIPFPNPIRDPYFWLLAVFCLVSIGTSEMVISNMGTIVLSLPPAVALGNTTSDTVASDQVRILSLSNTVSRIVVGPLADFVSPVASYLPSGGVVFPRKHRVSRIVFLSGSALLLGVACLWMEFRVKSREAVWLLSVGTGISYGTVFTVLPSIISSVWGLANLGRNFGIMTYAPFIGTPLFSYLYAFVSASNSHDHSICHGLSCWRATFWVTFGTSMVALSGSAILWKQWRGRV